MSRRGVFCACSTAAGGSWRAVYRRPEELTGRRQTCGRLRASFRWRLIAFSLCALILCCLQSNGAEGGASFLTFQVKSQATYPLSINEAGTVAGYYVDQSGLTHGFVRYHNGSIATFDVPGSLLTVALSINTAGVVTGYYEVPSTSKPVYGIPQGFVRGVNAEITTFGNGLQFSAQPVSVNVAGEIIGNYPGTGLGSIVFVRSVTGAVSTFSLSLGSHYSTIATGSNAGGAVVGYDSSQSLSLAQGFLWAGQGGLPTFAGGFTPIVVSGSTGTFPTAVNADGAVVGCYSTGAVYHDFLRYRYGLIETLAIPGTVPGCIAGFTYASGLFNVVPPSITLNDQGTITGYYNSTTNSSTAFILSEDGTMTTFIYPGSQQTIPTSINNLDVITGYYVVGTDIAGFIREP